MDEDIFNNGIRRFLKKLGVTAQREIEKSVRQALADSKLKGNENIQVEGLITLDIGLVLQIKDEIPLQ